MRWEREEQRYRCREHGCDSFPDYVEAVKRRLARHNFTHPFELDKDLKKQDQLTTWIEYLNYEYWWLDKYTGDIERLAPGHDKAWQELVDTEILRPHETEEFLLATASPMERASEREQAQREVERAESEARRIYVTTQEEPQRWRIPKAQRISMMRAGSAKLLAVKGRLDHVRSRNNRITNFIRETFDYADAKRDAARQRILVQWVPEQVPLIEAEMTQSKANKARSDGTRRVKRKPSTDEEPLARRDPKRPKLDPREPSPATSNNSAVVSVKATETQPKPHIVMDKEAGHGSTKDSVVGRSCQPVDDARATS